VPEFFFALMEIKPLLVYSPFYSASSTEHLVDRGHHEFDRLIHVYLDVCLPLANTGQPFITGSGLGGLSLEMLQYVDMSFIMLRMIHDPINSSLQTHRKATMIFNVQDPSTALRLQCINSTA
jgi:hypothetical protein